jgi:hypothetical protein
VKQVVVMSEVFVTSVKVMVSLENGVPLRVPLPVALMLNVMGEAIAGSAARVPRVPSIKSVFVIILNILLPLESADSLIE